MESKKYDINFLDSLYSVMNKFDTEALTNSEHIEIHDIKLALITHLSSLGMSLIKDIYLNNTNSLGYIFTIRSIIEGYSILLYLSKENISIFQEELFKIQSYIIEMKIYKKYPSFDKVLYYMDTIVENYQAKVAKIMNEYGLSKKQIDEILDSKIPFLGKKITIESILKENLPEEILYIYKSISLFIHPYDYRQFNSDIKDEYTEIAIQLLMVIFDERQLGDNGIVEEVDIHMRHNLIVQNLHNFCDLQKKILGELCQMLDVRGYKFLAFVIDECIGILYDYVFDISLGLVEQSTIKWKIVIEYLSFLNYVLDSEEKMKSYELIYHHTRVKKLNNINNDIDNEMQNAYDVYKKLNEESCTFEKFKNNFLKTTGYSIDTYGNIKSLKKLVVDFIEWVAPQIDGGFMKSSVKMNITDLIDIEKDEIIDINISDFLKLKYDESQVMSHSTGYLYNSTSGAWSDGTNLSFLFDELLNALIKKIHIIFMDLHSKRKIDKSIVNYLRNLIKKNNEIIKNKKGLFLLPKKQKNNYE